MIFFLLDVRDRHMLCPADSDAWHPSVDFRWPVSYLRLKTPGSGPAKQVPDESHQKQNQEDKEQDLRDACRRNSDAGETKQCGYQCNNEKR
jgi:hypothetical protein